MNEFNKILVEPLKQIDLSDGNVLHALKKTDKSFMGFGEVYFSKIKFKAVKAWKFHEKMSLNNHAF